MPSVHLAYHVMGHRKGNTSAVWCSLRRFESVLRFLQSEGIPALTIGEVAGKMAIAEELPKRFVTISFDDGLKSGRIAYRALRRHKMKATFFPIACTFEGKVPSVILLQELLKVVGEKVVRENFLPRWLSGTEYEKCLSPEYDFKGLYSNEPGYQVVKATLNAIAAPSFTQRVVMEMALEVFGEQKIANFVRTNFLTAGELKGMLFGGMEMGCHSYSHPKFDLVAKLEPAHLLSEIEKAIVFIEMATGANITSFAYPFGLTIEKVFVDALRSAGITGARNYIWKEDLPHGYGEGTRFNLPGIDGSVISVPVLKKLLA